MSNRVKPNWAEKIGSGRIAQMPTPGFIIDKSDVINYIFSSHRGIRHPFRKLWNDCDERIWRSLRSNRGHSFSEGLYESLPMTHLDYES